MFEGGRILAKSGVGAHALWGRVLSEYLDRNGADGALGFATSRVRATGTVGRSPTSSTARSCAPTVSGVDSPDARLVGSAQQSSAAFVSGALDVHANAWAKPSAIVVAWSAVIVPGRSAADPRRPTPPPYHREGLRRALRRSSTGRSRPPSGRRPPRVRPPRCPRRGSTATRPSAPGSAPPRARCRSAGRRSRGGRQHLSAVVLARRRGLLRVRDRCPIGDVLTGLRVAHGPLHLGAAGGLGRGDRGRGDVTRAGRARQPVERADADDPRDREHGGSADEGAPLRCLRSAARPAGPAPSARAWHRFQPPPDGAWAARSPVVTVASCSVLVRHLHRRPRARGPTGVLAILGGGEEYWLVKSNATGRLGAAHERSRRHPTSAICTPSGSCPPAPS